MTFDFSILYTKIPHHKLFKVLHELTNFCFDGTLHKYINVNRFGEKWVSNPDSYSLIFLKHSFKKVIEYIPCK